MPPPSAPVVPVLIAGVVLAVQIGVLWKTRWFAGPMRRKTDALPPGPWLLAGLCVWVLQGLLIAVLLGFLPNSGMLIASGVAIALCVWLGHRITTLAPATGMKLDVAGLLGGVVWFVMAVPMLFVVSAIATRVATWIAGGPPDVIAHDALREILSDPASRRSLFLIGYAVICAPIFEEYVYRGFLQAGVRSLAGGHAWTGILGAGVIFALVHWGMPWHAIATVFVLGIVCGYAMERTGKIGVPIMIHILFNGTNVVLALLIA